MVCLLCGRPKAGSAASTLWLGVVMAMDADTLAPRTRSWLSITTLPFWMRGVGSIAGNPAHLTREGAIRKARRNPRGAHLNCETMEAFPRHLFPGQGWMARSGRGGPLPGVGLP